MIKAKNIDKEILTPRFQEFLNGRESIIKTIEMTCYTTPEQYECFDEYGNQVAYLRVREGFTVECPECSIVNSVLVYANLDVKGWGNFIDDDERIKEMGAAFDAIENYYENTIKTIQRIETNDETIYVKKDPKYSDQDMMETLYKYQQSNFTPLEVNQIRKKGKVLGYRDALNIVIKDHRLIRSRYFPEADGADGLNEEHINQEVEWFKTADHKLTVKLNVINKLFDKTFDDFEEYFRERCTRGWNGLDW